MSPQTAPGLVASAEETRAREARGSAKAEHTPGPWYAFCPSDKSQPVIAHDHLDRPETEIRKFGRQDLACIFGTGGEADANAQLIAAAPTLLTALQTILRIREGHADPGGPDIADICRKAIAEVTA